MQDKPEKTAKTHSMSKINHPLTSLHGIVFDVDGVLSPSTVPMDEHGVPVRMANIKDGFAMQLAVKRGLQLAIITGANTPALISRYNTLGISDVYIGAAHKEPVLREWMAKVNLRPDEVVYCGDDIPDITCMRSVGLAVAPADAAPEVKSIAHYITVANGGYGVAREILEQILRAKGMWMDNAEAFGW